MLLKMFQRLLNLLRQTLRVIYAFFPQLLKSNDIWAKNYLSDAEYKLYLDMDVRDRHHGYLVTKKLLKKHPNASKVLIKAALLHDLGKSMVPYNPFGRILAHLYTPKNIPKTPYYPGVKGIWQRHIYHPDYGAEMIRKIVSCKRLAEIIERHHHPQGDEEAKILQIIDERF